MTGGRARAAGFVACFLTALIWGVAFVAQDVAAEYMGGFTFQSVRSFLAAAVLGLFLLVRDGIARKKGTYKPLSAADRRVLWLGGAVCGAILCAASCLQQFGIANNVTSPGKDAFVTALYIVFVPVAGAFLGRRAQPHVYACVAVALGGLWLLCMNGATLGKGDILVISCAFVFTLHILTVDRIGPRVDAVRLSCVQFLVGGVLSGILMLAVERPAPADVLQGWLPLLYAGLLSCGVAYTLQIVGQKLMPAVVASLIMSLESVFAVLASMLMLRAYPTPREWAGMGLIFLAVIFSQVPIRYGKKRQTAAEQAPGDESPT